MARARTRPTRQDTANQLIEGARRAFVERGFYGASIDVICASAGLTRGAFYSAFGKKEDLFFALYDRMISDVSALFIEGLDRAVRDELDPVDALFEALAEHFPIGRDWYVLNAEFTLFAIRDADAAKALAARRHALRAVIADKLDVALARSGRKAMISSELFARAVIGLAVDGLGQSLIEPDMLGATTLLQTFMSPLVHSLSVPDEDADPSAEKASTGGGPPAPASDTTKSESGSEIDIDVKRRLLTAAQTAFLRDGYGRTRVSDIAKSAGISKKTIYAHAPSKSALFAAVVHEAIGHAVDDERPLPAAARDLESILVAYLMRYAHRCFSEVGVRVYGLVVSEAWQFPDLVRAYLDAARNMASADVARLLAAHAEQGREFLTSPESAASMLIEMAVAEPLRLAALGIRPRPDEGEIERRVLEAVAMFLNGATAIGRSGANPRRRSSNVRKLDSFSADPSVGEAS